ncbi:hypothetical protein J21TS3_47940 [Paenibacillus cookii]|uniref:Uncharacterized protein n=1 Tax=Paenibacillus cookii TaxID=157839 RepID=A0ABQ4M3I9_9BACL|nr:hypothetical protein J21TS3_47940 [Paenibacillus cookii]
MQPALDRYNLEDIGESILHRDPFYIQGVVRGPKYELFYGSDMERIH